MARYFFRSLELVAAGTVGAIFASMIAVAWTGPSAAPPANNAAAPINISSVDQVKNGGFSVNALAVFGNAILSGTSRYLNFGTTAGASGYGIRDNAGTMEFKNATGSWNALTASKGFRPVYLASPTLALSQDTVTANVWNAVNYPADIPSNASALILHIRAATEQNNRTIIDFRSSDMPVTRVINMTAPNTDDSTTEDNFMFVPTSADRRIEINVVDKADYFITVEFAGYVQ